MGYSFLAEWIPLLPLAAVGLALSIGIGQTGRQTAHVFDGLKNPRLGNRYLLYLPVDHTWAGKAFPFIYFLHGAGERGNDPKILKRQALPKIVETIPGFRFIVVSPQCPAYSGWSMAFLTALLDEIVPQLRVDTDRIYLTGISMGGYATWSLASLQPDRFAAVAPVCGGGDPSRAHRLKDLPIWAFHGALDDIVPPGESQTMVDAVREAGGTEVRFTVYPEAGHDSWTPTYNNPELYDWFLAHKRK